MEGVIWQRKCHAMLDLISTLETAIDNAQASVLGSEVSSLDPPVTRTRLPREHQEASYHSHLRSPLLFVNPLVALMWILE